MAILLEVKPRGVIYQQFYIKVKLKEQLQTKYNQKRKKNKDFERIAK